MNTVSLRSLSTFFVAVVSVFVFFRPCLGDNDVAARPLTLTRRDIDAAAALLSLSPAQTQAARNLYDGYSADIERARAAAERRVAEAQREYEGNGDAKALRSPEVQETIRSSARQTASLGTQLLADLRSLLTAEQTGSWVRVERLIRRREALSDGKLCGEDIDLGDVLGQLKHPAAEQGNLRATLEKYESELDQALTKRTAARADLQDRLNRIAGDANSDEAKALLAEFRKAGLPVRDVNDRYAALIGAILADESKGEFQQCFNKRKYSRIYKDSYTLLALDGAAAFRDLDSDKLGSLGALRVRYVRDLAAANARWAGAVAALESDGGGSPYWRLGLDPPSPSGPAEREVVQAGEARREIDRATLAALKSLLTEDQRNRLDRIDVSSPQAR